MNKMHLFAGEKTDKIDAINGEINTTDPGNIATIDMTNPLGKNWKKLIVEISALPRNERPSCLKDAHLLCYSLKDEAWQALGEAENVYESSNEDNDNGSNPEFVPPSDVAGRRDVKDEPQSDPDDAVGEGTFLFNVRILFCW